MKKKVALIVAAGGLVCVLSGVGWALFRSDGAAAEPSHLAADLSVQELADEELLFTDLGERYASLSKTRMRWKRLTGSVERSELPDQINWASDIYEAIERATAEDKPIFFITFCRENGCQDRDV